jgi:hypothetical protein
MCFEFFCLIFCATQLNAIFIYPLATGLIKSDCNSYHGQNYFSRIYLVQCGAFLQLTFQGVPFFSSKFFCNYKETKKKFENSANTYGQGCW